VTSRTRDPPIDADFEPLMNQTLAATFPDATAPGVRAVPDATDPRVRTARRVFLGALAFNAALTLLWLWSYATGRGTAFFSDYRITGQAIGQVAGFILFFYVIWGFVWWGIKNLLLRKWVGFTKEEARDAFSSRMDRAYDVGTLTTKYSERRIRIADMIGRRGRFITLAAMGLSMLYLELKTNPKADFALVFANNNLFAAVATGWIFLGVFYLNGVIGAAFYGPQSRVMDGYLARANNLLITTLWAGFTFVMVPISRYLAPLFPREEFPVVFAMIWLSYVATDACAEIFGSLFGRQSIKVWGVGDVNRKSVVGVVAGFLGAFILCTSILAANGLATPAWIGLAFVIALSNCLVELYSPRGTDDFTMATTNALICLAFGMWIR
jgi:hypothetical protein